MSEKKELHLGCPRSSGILFQQDLGFLGFISSKGPEASASLAKSVLLETVAHLDYTHQ